jgi:hypothetical protein
MKRTLWNWIAAVMAVAAIMPAYAQQRRPLRERPPLQQRQEMPQRGFQQHEFQQGENSRGEGGQPGRMSPDERRQLRRDIHDAGRELYRGERRPPLQR